MLRAMVELTRSTVTVSHDKGTVIRHHAREHSRNWAMSNVDLASVLVLDDVGDDLWLEAQAIRF